jgi:ankyrin repeat protein
VLNEKCNVVSIWKRPRTILRTLIFYTLLILVVLNGTSCGSAAEKTNLAAPDAALWQAIAEDDPEGVLAALKAGANIDSTDPPEELMMQFRYDFRDTPPFIATIILKKTDLALLLLENGARPESRGPRGSTAVQVAVAMGDERVFSALLAKGEDIQSDLVRPGDSEPIHLIDFAARGGSLKIMAAVQEAGHALPTDRQGQLRVLTNSLMGTPEVFEYLVGETGIELSPELKQGLIQKAREYRLELFLRYFHQQGYIPEDSLGQVLAEAIQVEMDGLAEDILTGHPDLWPQEMGEAIAQRIDRGDPGPMIDLFSRLGKERLLVPHLGKIFLRYGKNGDAEKIWALLGKFQAEKSQEPELLGFALVGALKTIHHEQEWSRTSRDRPVLEVSRFNNLIEKILQQPQVDIHLADEEGRTPLWFAINTKREELARRLLTKGAKATPDHSGSYSTPSYLHSAFQHGMDGLVPDLIAAGANLEAEDEHEVTPLELVAKKGDLPMVEKLLTAGADPNHYIPDFLGYAKSSNPFIGAVERGDAGMVSLLLMPDAKWKIESRLLRQGLKMSLKAEHSKIAEKIIFAMDDPGSPDVVSRVFHDIPPVIFALRTDQPWMIQALLKRGVQLVPDGYTPTDMMCYSVGERGLEMTRVLLAAGLDTDVSCPGYPLLSRAALNGDPALVELLLERGVDIDEAIKPGAFEWNPFEGDKLQGWTPLMFAAAEGKPEIVEVLARNGAALDVLGQTRLESERYVLQQEPTTATALMLAAENGHADIIRTLVRAGAEIDQANSEGYTALMTAARYGQVETVKTLLLLGADPFLVNRSGNDVLKLATLSKEPKVQELLRGSLQ